MFLLYSYIFVFVLTLFILFEKNLFADLKTVAYAVSNYLFRKKYILDSIHRPNNTIKASLPYKSKAMMQESRCLSEGLMHSFPTHKIHMLK